MIKIIIKLKKTYKTFLVDINDAINLIQEYYNRKTCPHYFRPASMKDKPGKFCNMCDTFVKLTPEEYYSEFGELGWKNWGK